MRKILIAALGVVALLIVVGVVVVLNLGAIVETGVERGGTLVLGVPTTLDNADVSVLGGTAGLDGLVIGSPEGFSAPEMFRLSHAHATVDVGSLRGDVVVVHEVVIDGAEVTLELAGGRTNWGTVMERLEREPTGQEEKAKSKKKVRLERLVFSNGKVRIAGIPLAGTATVPLPGFELTNLGSGGQQEMTVRQTLTEVIGSLYKAVLTAASDVVPAEELAKVADEAKRVLGEAGALVKDAGAKAGQAAGEAGTVVKDAGGKVGEAAGEAGETLKGAAGAVGGAAGEAAQKAKGVLGGILGGGKDEEEQ